MSVKSRWVRITKTKVLQEHTEIERFLVAADPRSFLESSEVKLTGIERECVCVVYWYSIQ
jgi:hypothetical protein